jgi:gamma-glutamyltranspeptidase / glutathione hydrolase
MGGANHPQAHVQVMLNLVVFGMDAQAALDAPRVRHVREQRVFFGRRIPASVLTDLTARGHVQVALPDEPDGGIFGTGRIIRRLARGYEAGSAQRRRHTRHEGSRARGTFG